jgi:hypothetical protein
MKQSEIAKELQDIKKMLQTHQHTLEEIRDGRISLPKKHHWKILLAIAALTLFIGSFGAYQYYLVLQSIIDQFPRSVQQRTN